MDKDALIHEIGRLIVADVDAGPAWDGYALVVRYADGARKLSGFRYRDGQAPQAATPRAAALGERIDALREATQMEGKSPWDAGVIRILRATGKITVDFEYDAPDRWDIGPGNLAEVAERARPV